MREYVTLAVDGINEDGEPDTMYIRHVGGTWHWWFDAARSCTDKPMPDNIPESYKRLLTDYGTPYKVSVKYMPESFVIEKVK